MRKHVWLLVALAALLWVAVDVHAQMWGGRGGGFGRRGGGGRFGRGFRPDPGAMFDRFANGKTVIKRADLNPWLQRMFDNVAKAAGVTNGQLTRDQWIKGSQAAFAQFGGGGGASAPSAEDQAKAAEAEFKKLDANGDGKLNADEMPKDLAAELTKWDTNKDGLIDLQEYTAYYKAKHQPQAGGGADSFGDIPVEVEEEDTRPVVYHAGTVPKELQATFGKYDMDGDGQISLYEWRQAGGSISEFLAMDRNNDGLVTVEEMLYYQAKQKAAGQGAGSPTIAAAGNDVPRRGPGGN